MASVLWVSNLTSATAEFGLRKLGLLALRTVSNEETPLRNLNTATEWTLINAKIIGGMEK